MAYWIQETGTHRHLSNYKSFICDYCADIEKLPRAGIPGSPQEGDTVSSAPCSYGSDTFVLEDSSVYILGKDTNEWQCVKVADTSNGQKGDPGKDGKDAPSIVEVNVDENNILSVKLSDGKELIGGTIKTLQGEKGKDGVSVQKGGSKGQVLAKKSDADYDMEWIDFSGSSSGGNIEDYTTIQGVLGMEFDDDNFAFVQGTL